MLCGFLSFLLCAHGGRFERDDTETVKAMA